MNARDADRSVDRDLLADYLGGALDATRARRVQELIAGDPAWHSAADEMTTALSAVAEDLAAVRRTPEVMPSDVAQRFDELFAAPGLQPTAPQPARGGVGERKLGRDRAARSRRWVRWGAPIMAGAALLAFAGLGLPQLLRGSIPDMGAAESANDDDSSMPLTAGGEPVLLATGRDYQRDDARDFGAFSSPVPRAASSSPEEAPKIDAQSENLARPVELNRLAQPAELAACLSAVTGDLPGQVTVVDYARFEGTPALVISITSVDGRWLFAAGAGCRAGDPDELFRTPLT